MSLKIKNPNGKIWIDPKLTSYNYPIEISNIKHQDWSAPTLKMSIHPDWLEMMDKLQVGDVVTTHENHVGVITKIYEITSLGMRKYEVLIGNKKEIYFSMSLKKIEDKKHE